MTAAEIPGRSAASAPIAPSRPDQPRRGSRLLAAAVVLAPLIVAAAIVVHPDDTTGATDTLARLGGDERALWTTTHLLEAFGWLFVGVTLLLALPRLAPARGRRAVTTGATLALIGYASLAFVVYGHGEAYLFLSADGMETAAIAPVFDQYQDGMPLAAMPTLLARLGLLVAGLGLIVARTIPLWAAILITVSPLFALVQPALPLALGLLAAFGPMTAAMIAAAPRIAASGGPALPAGAD